MSSQKNISNYQNEQNIINVKYVMRYLSFYRYFIASVLMTLILAFFYLRYADFKYESTARIEIIDDAMDSEMALPTAMTIFNRSMINLQNEMVYEASG